MVSGLQAGVLSLISVGVAIGYVFHSYQHFTIMICPNKSSQSRELEKKIEQALSKNYFYAHVQHNPNFLFRHHYYYSNPDKI